jgi:hypothetical protein
MDLCWPGNRKTSDSAGDPGFADVARHQRVQLFSTERLIYQHVSGRSFSL